MRHVCRRVVLWTIVSVGSALVTMPAMAQGQAPARADAPAQKPSSTKLDEARQRYERGLQLFNEANYEAARVEFERAYQLAPTYKILYNVGLCYEQLGDYVQALTTLQRYLEQGGKEISDERRNEVAKELNQIKPRIAKVTLHTNVPGAELLVDDACATEATSGNVQCGPLDSLSRVVLMNPGRRRVTLRHDNYFQETQVVTVAGSDQIEVTVNLKPLPKPVALRSRRVPWVGWAVTGALAVGSGAFGFFALRSSSDLDDLKQQRDADPDKLNSDSKRTKAYSYIADGLAAGAVIAGAVSLYLTIKWGKEAGTTEEGSKTAKAVLPQKEIRLSPGPGSFLLQGRF